MRLHVFLVFITTAMAMAQNEGGGPSILSRGGNGGTRGTEAAVLTFSAGVDAVVDGSLSLIPDSSQAINKQESAEGVEARATLSGTHRWRRSSLGLSYAGSYVNYAGNNSYNGTTQSLNLSFNTQHSKRLTTNYKLAAGTSNRPYGALGGLYGGGGALDTLDPNFLAVPVQELFNNRVNYVQGGAGFVYQKSSRLSFGVSASGYGVRREAKGLGGMNGYLGNADLSYRMNKRATFSITYSFTHFEYPGAFGASDMHGFGGGYARSIGRDWQLNVSGQLVRVESLGLARVELDPIVASLLGQTSGVEAFYRLNYIPAASFSLSRRMRNSSLNFIASKGVNPGNGLYLTSQQTSLGGSYTYSGIRHWSVYLSAGYQELSSLTRAAGKFKGVNAGVGLSRDIFRTLHFTSRWDYRDQIIESSSYGRAGSRISVGLAWSPRPVPLAIW